MAVRFTAKATVSVAAIREATVPLTCLPEVEMACRAHEMDDGIKFSLRSIEPRQVSGLAARFGGGGHAQASGCTVYAPLNEAVRLIREAALEELSR